VNHDLDLSNIEAGQFELEMIDFDLKWVLEQTLAGVAAGAAAKELVLKLVLVPGIPRTVAGDAVRLRQILANLLNNAVEFAEAGEIRLMAEAPEANACHVHFGIRFCAGGWPEGRHEKVNSCRVLLRQMGGELALLREDDQRLVFTFDLKFTPCSREKGPTAPLPDKPEGQAHGIRILIAEDSEDSRFLLQEFLKRGPYEVTFAENGKLALEAALTQTFDLILMDIQMPVMDGLTATRLIREAEAREGRAVTPLLALTAHTRKADIELSIAAGCNAHISKPISKVGLLETIQKYSPARQMPVEAIA
jgi:CheY-like chemotaxis protein